MSPENEQVAKLFKKFHAQVDIKQDDYSPYSSHVIISVEKTALAAIIKELKKMPNASMGHKKPMGPCALSPEFPY